MKKETHLFTPFDSVLVWSDCNAPQLNHEAYWCVLDKMGLVRSHLGTMAMHADSELEQYVGCKGCFTGPEDQMHNSNAYCKNSFRLENQHLTEAVRTGRKKRKKRTIATKELAILCITYTGVFL